MKNFYPFVLLLALLTAACSTEPEEVNGELEAPRLKSISTEVEEVVLAPQGEATFDFRVEEPAFDFNFNPQSEECALSLRLANDLAAAPAQVALQAVSRGDKAGCYVATLRELGAESPYAVEVALAIKREEGEYLYTRPFVVSCEGSDIGNDDDNGDDDNGDDDNGDDDDEVVPETKRGRILSFELLRSENPSLESDLRFEYDEATRLFSAATPNYVRSMEFVARFETEGEVDSIKVEGRHQHSGITVNNFKQQLTYTLYSGDRVVDYRVELTNFTGLPVMWIETPNGQAITSKEVWVEGSTLFIDGAGQFDDLEEMGLSIRGRGNSTWGYEKKPYNIKLDSKKELLGMPKHKRWCLLANYMDRTMLRNRVAYHLAELTSLDWTPRTRFVELFLNGRHQGCYLLAEHIKVDENRVNITEMESSDNAGEAVTGGYLLELDFHFDNEWQWHSSHNIPFAVKYPEEEDLTSEQLAWIKGYIAEAESALYGSNFRDPEVGYAAYIDIDSFIDYWLVYELSVNHELANPGSVYLHKERSGKLEAGPIWDFDWGTFSYNASPAAQTNLFMTHAWWYGRLFSDKAFKLRAVERWQELEAKFLTALDFVAEEAEYTARSAEENFKLWSISTTINGDESLPVDEAVARLKRVLKERIAIVDRKIGEWAE